MSAYVRRIRRIVVAGLIGAALLLPAGLAEPPTVAAATSAGRDCSRWTSTTRPPEYIRVYRNGTGRIERVPFRRYVITVLGKEWPGYLPRALVQAGAVAVKQYAWYHALRGPRHTSDGRCYDVRNGTSDQLYLPERARVTPVHHNAVDETWGVVLYKQGTLFMTGYRRGEIGRCGSDATGWKLFARSGTRCAYAGKDYLQILRIYYGPDLTIASGGSRSSTSVESSSTRAVRQPRVVDDRSVAIDWRGTWRRSRSWRAVGETLTSARGAGASATFRFWGGSLEVLGRRGPDRGWLRIYIDGRLRARVNTYATTGKDQATLFNQEFRSARWRTVRIVVSGTADRPRVDLDAFVIRP